MTSFRVIEKAGTKNLIVNPSMEKSSTGYIAGAGHTLARTDAESFRGVYSGKFTDGGANLLIMWYDITLATASTFVATAWIWVDPAWDGGNLSLQEENYLGASASATVTWTAGTDPTGEWFRIESEITIAADGVGSIVLQTSSSPSNGKYLYFDAFQVELAATSTMYCDGDQPGSSWIGTPHASASKRSALDRSAGAEKDLEDDYGFYVRSLIGAGVMPVVQNTQPYALLPGSHWQSTKERSRKMSLIGGVAGRPYSALHAVRDSLIAAFTRDYMGQPATLRYYGADVNKEIQVYYEDGLGFGGEDGGFEKINLRLLAPDPMWKSLDDRGHVLDPNDTFTSTYCAARLAVNTDVGPTIPWSNQGPPLSGATVQRVKIGPDKKVYYGHNSGNWDLQVNNAYIVQWDPVTEAWVSLATGLSATCNDIDFGADGIMYVAGNFSNAGGDANADLIAQWDGTAFSALGDPTAGGATLTSGQAVHVSEAGEIYVGGDFLNLGGVANADYIAKWNGTAWVALGTVTNNKVYDIVSDGTDIYACGDFTTIGGVAAARIAKWDGTVWTPLGSGLNGTGWRMAIADDGTLYVGGQFTTAGGVAAARIAKWDGKTWTALDVGVNNAVFDVNIGPDGKLWLSGAFTTAGGIALSDGIAVWNGFTYAHLDADLPGAGTNWKLDLGEADPRVLANYDIYMAGSGSGSAQVSGDTVVTNPGTAFARPVIGIARDGGTSAIITNLRNEDTGRELLFNYSLLDGETLTIDLRPGRQSIVSSRFGDRMDAVLNNSDFSDWGLLPGDNLISLLVVLAGAPTITATLQYRPLYKSFDD